MALVVKTLPVQNIRKIKNKTPSLSKKITFGKKAGIDRRTRTRARRYSDRNGIVVRFSFRPDRRRSSGRRKTDYPVRGNSFVFYLDENLKKLRKNAAPDD